MTRRGPRRQPVDYSTTPKANIPRVRDFVVREREAVYNRRDENGHPVRTRENRVEWQREADRLADWVLRLHPAVQRKLTVFVVRCPVKGCLLGRVYKILLKPSGVRYMWLGASHANVGKAGIVNWGWDGYRGSKEHMLAGCEHGEAMVEIGLLYEMVEALEDWGPQKRPDDWLTHYSKPVQRGYRRRTVVLDPPEWTPVP